MKSPAIRKLRQKLANDEPVYGLWVTLESASITEMGVALGLDWIVVDAEHGHLDWRDILEHIRATVRSDTVVLVRIAELNIGLIKRALDIGADGVVVPWMEEVDQLRDAVAFAHYPPDGLRGIGAERATCWGQCFVEHVEEADEHVLVVPIIESVRGGDNIDQLLEVDGVEVFFFGPADYSSTAGFPGQWEGPGVAQMIQRTKDAIRAAGKNCGVVATSNDNLDERRDQGFRMLALGLDGGLLLRSLRGALDHVGRDRTMAPSFKIDSNDGAFNIESNDAPLEAATSIATCPFAVTPPGSGITSEITRDIHFECLVGPHNGATNLMTGISTFAPGAHLPYHLHPYGESLTLLSGQIIVEVEGRMYRLQPRDNMTIPAGLAHTALNPSQTEPAIIHGALPTTQPERTSVDQFFSRRRLPADSAGQPGAERIVRFAEAPRRPEAQHISTIDFFNTELAPDLGMNGGLTLLESPSRSPARQPEQDESICAIQGQLACTVGGQGHALGNCATALLAHNQVHHITNENAQPAAFIWVQAGPSVAAE
ncbi:MAG: cupin domain-containing protein [Candidatus Latescibacteria bacterium]|nr:cupin domain-containing protein [Candidatus Latescibacterota bacterium]